MGEFIKRLFESDFMPHGFCWQWEPWVVWTNVVSDLTIFLCYQVIGFTLLKVAAKRKDMVSNPVTILFGAFIVFCGCTHAMEVWNTWHGHFRLAGLVKVATAMVSVLAVGPLMEILPKLLAVPALAEVLTMNAALSSEQQEKRRMAGQLRESRDRFRLLVEGIKDYAIFLVDPGGLVTSWNPGATRITGYSEGEILGQPHACFFPEEDSSAGHPDKILRQAAASGRFEEEGWRIREDGTRFLANGVATAFYDVQGQVQGFAMVIRDITEQRAVQVALENLAEGLEDQVRARVQELRESEARLQGFIRHSPAAIAFKGLDGRYLLLNPRMEAAMSRPSADIIGRTDADLLPPERSALARERDLQVIRLGQTVQVEEEWVHGDGSIHPYLVNAFPMVDALGRDRGLGIIATDITERKQADRALLQSQKLESLGVLAGGIAHDFNNLLGAMQGNVELAMTEASLGQAMPHLETLKGLMGRAADLLRQMLAYSGMGRFTVRAVDLNRLVGELTQLLGTSISKKARLVLDLQPDLPPMEADPTQIQQVIMNLVINASEAIGDQTGEIAVTTRLVQVTRRLIEAGYKDQPLDTGPHICLEVTDTGIGMAPEVLKRIFDPFFTTKFTGRGLGLAAIHGIVRSHHGGIQVRSEPGRGSAFRVLFPALPGRPVPAEPDPPALPPGAAPPPTRGPVLVVDDEAEVRSVVARALGRAGIGTIQARDGREALELALRHGGRIQLILMDLTMPVMDGAEACRELRLRGVTVPVLLSSGFSEPDALRRFEGLGLAGFIQKPFDLASLLARVRALLPD